MTSGVTTTNGFASYLERIEKEGVSGLRSLKVPLLGYEGEYHLKRSSGIRLCDWRTGGDAQYLTAGELAESEHLCAECFPGAFGTWLTLHDLDTAGAISLAGLVIETVEEAEKSLKRVLKGQRVSSSKLYSQLHGLRRLHKDAGNSYQWPMAPAELLEDLGERAQSALQALQRALTSEAHEKVLLERVRASQAKLKDPGLRMFDHGTLYLIEYGSDISQSLTMVPMLASEVVATYQIPQDKGVTVLVLSGEVAEYLNRVATRSREWRLRSFQAHGAPTDPIVRETAIGIWEPGGSGELSNFEKAVEAAKALHGQ